MKVYEQRFSLTAVTGATTGLTLKNVGGLLRYLLIQAGSSTTTFQATIEDYKGKTRKRYGFHTGELIDEGLTMPISGEYNVKILNGSIDDTFYVVFGVQES